MLESSADFKEWLAVTSDQVGVLELATVTDESGSRWIELRVDPQLMGYRFFRVRVIAESAE